MQDLTLDQIHPDNYIYLKNPDRNFSAIRNRTIIADTIADYEKMRFGIDEKVQKATGNVTDILASFAKYKLDEGKGKQIEDWLGKHWMSKIYGERLLDKVKARQLFERQAKLDRKRLKVLPKGFYL